MLYYYSFYVIEMYIYYGKAEFSASLLQYLVSHDLSEVILISSL